MTGIAFSAVMLAACRPAAESGPVIVSAIGEPPRLFIQNARMRDTPSRLLVDATAQGLVRFDAAGQIEPGLAERWIVIDQGRSYIFRLREGRWADGRPIDAPTVAKLLARQIRRGGRHPLAPFLTAIDSVVAMTPQVIEIRLARPRPDLLKLFAQPELAIVRTDPLVGSGPLMIASGGETALLRPVPDPEGDAEEEPAADRPDVRLIGERAARAVARFAASRIDLVAGGNFANWPLIQAAGLPATAVRVDPAVGLFGLAIVRRDGFLADAASRAAVAQAIDRDAVTAAVAPGWDPVERLLPAGLDSATSPAPPAWALATLAERQAAARVRVAAWTGEPIVLRIALPQGSGATRLWGALAASLRRVGIDARRVEIAAPADLRLVDAVAPYDNARWYLATACQPCGAEALDRLNAARTADTLAERAARTAEADAALTADVAFIPLARPLRWSLVAPSLTAWTLNARAWHPLNHLRLPPT